MKDISHLYRVLSPERLKAMEGILERRELTLESFKLMKKDYSQVKSKVKQIEKKLLSVMEQEGNDASVCKWVEREVIHIENKYKDIDHAIKHYKIAMSGFNRDINRPEFWSFPLPETHSGFYSHPLGNLRSHLSTADGRINDAMNAMRITERYFKNVASTFKSHANLVAIKKQAEQRLRLLNEKQSGSDEVSPTD